ncbi:sugar phosphate isomerase/epimerase family protein [Stratiformator vulcanicus]|uniref:D-tagatose 3-epimerase n=1 Tax=Stratiformator vulcanicus TaxID=2527980 RepID=A0A517QYY4_9PLAN|nr:sugar phosphate isomerase/epimerase family protein [Stratiformator vulcanicus]QDT36750.1 D-tagatose 3-epimerase [Stratiformator vulcanicus]
MKFAMCQELFADLSWEEQCRKIAGFGYEGIEVAPFTLAPNINDVTAAQRGDLRRTAEATGLEIIGLHWLLAKTEGFHLTTDDESVRERTAEYLIALADCCADLGGELMVFGSPQQRGLQNGMSREDAMANAVGVIQAAMPTCEVRGVKICIEPLAPNETDFINTCAEGVELIERVGSPNVCLHQDVKAMLGGENVPVPQVIKDFARWTGHFHANDVNLQGPGMGDVSFEPIFEALKQSAYDGWVSVEVFDYSPGGDVIAERSIDYMRDVWSRV